MEKVGRRVSPEMVRTANLSAGIGSSHIVRSNGGAGGRILGPDYALLGEVPVALTPNRLGLLLATLQAKGNSISWTYYGPDDPFLNKQNVVP
jgi:hypothetical protein